MNELKDIKPLLEIPDISYYFYIGFLVFIGVLLFTLLFFLLKKFWFNRKVNMQKVYFERLKGVNWKDAKKSAYEITYLGRNLCLDRRIEEIYHQLLPMLEQYKYKKEVPLVNSETLKQYNLLVHVIDESI